MLKATSFTCKKKLQLLNFSIRYAFWRKQSRVDESIIMKSYLATAKNFTRVYYKLLILFIIKTPLTLVYTESL
jgi:hypothetical protein